MAELLGPQTRAAGVCRWGRGRGRGLSLPHRDSALVSPVKWVEMPPSVAAQQCPAKHLPIGGVRGQLTLVHAWDVRQGPAPAPGGGVWLGRRLSLTR